MDPKGLTDRHKKLSVRPSIIATLVLLAATVVASFTVHRAHHERLESTFVASTKNVSTGLREHLLFLEQTVYALANLFETEGEVSREQFSNAAAHQIPKFLGIQALEWVQAVSSDQRTRREQEAQNAGIDGFVFKQWQQTGEWKHSTGDWADEYFPVYYAHPFEGNEEALGIDLASHPECNRAMLTAKSSGQTTATGRITLAQEGENQFGFLLLVPVSEKGFAVGVFSVHDLVEAVLINREVEGLALRIVDRTSNDNKEQILYETSGYSADASPKWLVTTSHEIGGRTWDFTWSYLPEYVASELRWSYWPVLLIGTVFSILVGYILDQLNRRKSTEESVTYFRNLVDFASPLAWITELDSNCSWFNRRWLEYCGKSMEEQLGFLWLDSIHPDDREEVQATYLSAFKRQSAFELNYRIRRHDGEYRWFNANATPRVDEAGRFCGYVGMSFDNHEARTDKLALERHAAELERTNRELEQFAYVASHDLQEPLRKMSSYSQLLFDECGKDINEDGREYLGIVMDGATRMKNLTNDLLAFSRINSRGKELEIVDTQVCYDVALENLEIMLKETNAKVSNILFPPVVADANQLVLLFQNLVGNAIKYCEKTPQVHVGGQDRGDFFEFSVQDNGIGIEAQYYERIFGIFKRLHSRDEYSGTGIGLANCKRIVERFGGSIWLESTPGEGSVFYFTILKASTKESEV